MSASSYRPISLTIAGSSATQYLTPNSLSYYDNMDSRSSLSFQLRMPSSDTRPSVGQPIYLAAGTSQVYTTMAGIRNSTFGGELTSTDVGYGWLGGMSTRYWLKRIDGLKGAISLTSDSLKFVNSATSTDQVLGVYQNLRGTYSSNAIPIEPYADYRISVDANLNIATLNGGNIQMAVFTGSASTMATLTNITDSTSWTGAASLTTTFTNTTHRYMDVKLGVNGEEGTVIFDNLLLEKITPPYIFGGTLDNYKQSVYPFTSYMQLDCNAVDFSQMVDKRVVYYSYKSSGLGDFTFVNTSETFTGDGVTRAWALSYPAASSVDPAIYLMTDPPLLCDTTSVGGTSTHGYYYTPSSNFILGNTSNSAPATTDSLKVVYQAQVGAAMYDSDIIKHINENFLNGEILDGETCVVKGSTINEINFNYVPVYAALNTICSITGRNWYIDPWRRIHYAYDTETAPFVVRTTSPNWRDLSIKHSRDKYHNRLYVLGSYGNAMTTESFKGDGYTRTWTVAKAIQDTPMVKIDGYPVSVGVAGVASSTMAAYWNKATNQIATNTTNAALGTADWITIQYPALTPIVGVTNLLSKQSTRAEIELNSGIYEIVDASNTFYTQDGVYYYGQNVCVTGSSLTQTVTFETDCDGLVAGMLLLIIIPENGVNGTYMITSISARDVERRTMRYKVTAKYPFITSEWATYFRSLVTDKNKTYGEQYENLKSVTQDIP